MRSSPRYVTWPNAVTAVRASMIPPLCMLLWSRHLVLFSLLVAAFFALDVVDGLLARRLGQNTSFGRNFDISVDFAVALALGLTLAAQGRVPLWFGLPFVLNYVVVLGIAAHAARLTGWVWVPAEKPSRHAIMGYAWLIVPVYLGYGPTIDFVLFLYLLGLAYLTWEYRQNVAAYRLRVLGTNGSVDRGFSRSE